jgi:hypothetical protein
MSIEDAGEKVNYHLSTAFVKRVILAGEERLFMPTEVEI